MLLKHFGFVETQLKQFTKKSEKKQSQIKEKPFIIKDHEGFRNLGI